MLATLVGIAAYIVLTCVAQKKNVIQYMADNKVTLLATALVCFLLSMFGKAAMIAVIMAFLVPYLAAYSIPSLLGKLGDIWLRIQAWGADLFNSTKPQ